MHDYYSQDTSLDMDDDRTSLASVQKPKAAHCGILKWFRRLAGCFFKGLRRSDKKQKSTVDGDKDFDNIGKTE
jgi:hypothetical protein